MWVACTSLNSNVGLETVLPPVMPILRSARIVADDLVDQIDRPDGHVDDVGPSRASPRRPVFAAPGHDVDLVVDSSPARCRRYHRVGDAVEPSSDVDCESWSGAACTCTGCSGRPWRDRRPELEHQPGVALGGTSTPNTCGCCLGRPSARRLDQLGAYLAIASTLVWYGISVTMIDAAPPLPSTTSATEFDAELDAGLVGVADAPTPLTRRLCRGPRTNAIRSSTAVGIVDQMERGVDDSPRLCGGMLVAIPTAMPWLPLTSSVSSRSARTAKTAAEPDAAAATAFPRRSRRQPCALARRRWPKHCAPASATRRAPRVSPSVESLRQTRAVTARAGVA